VICNKLYFINQIHFIVDILKYFYLAQKSKSFFMHFQSSFIARNSLRLSKHFRKLNYNIKRFSRIFIDKSKIVYTRRLFIIAVLRTSNASNFNNRCK